jgi:hypothetical protein
LQTKTVSSLLANNPGDPRVEIVHPCPDIADGEAAAGVQDAAVRPELIALHPVYYLQGLEKCIVEILDVIVDTENHLLNLSCVLLLRDCLDIIQQGAKLSKFEDHVVSFFLSFDQLVHKGETRPLERLARPPVEQSLPAIKFVVRPDT